MFASHAHKQKQEPLIKKYLGEITRDLNGEDFYEFVGLIHQYAQQKYRYENSVASGLRHKKRNRFFSFDPSFWVSKPISIELKENGKIQLAFREQFTGTVYEGIETDPYESVALHFTGGKNTGHFQLTEDNVYTTSGLMAYALCGSVQTSNARILGFTLLNTFLLATGVGEFGAAMQAGSAGRAAWAATDMVLGLGGILVKTKYKEQLDRSEGGRTVLRIWEGLNLLYGGARISSELYNLCINSRQTIEKLKAVTPDNDAEMKAFLNETETQVGNVKSSRVGNTIVFSELRNAGDDLILNLVNKVDNVIDDVGKAALQAADVTDEIVKTSNSITDAAKKFWANHEINCTNYLQQTYGRVNVGRQITVDITLSDRKAVTCRLDNLVKQGNTYKIIDAKSSIVSNLGVKNADDLVSRFSTPNQKTFYDALRNGQVRSIKPRGQRAADYFLGFGGIPDSGINVGNSVEFLVNDAVTDGYKIHKKIFEF